MELIGVEEAAEMLLIPIPTARHWRATGYGPRSRRLGKRVVYIKSEVEAWIRDQFDQPEELSHNTKAAS